MSTSAQPPTLHPASSLDGPFNAAALRAAPLRTDPYPYLIAQNCLRAEILEALRRDFPRLERPAIIRSTPSLRPEPSLT